MSNTANSAGRILIRHGLEDEHFRCGPAVLLLRRRVHAVGSSVAMPWFPRQPSTWYRPTTVSVAGSITTNVFRSCKLTYTFRATGSYCGTPVSLSKRNTLTRVSVLTSMTLSAFARSLETYALWKGAV